MKWSIVSFLRKSMHRDIIQKSLYLALLCITNNLHKNIFHVWHYIISFLPSNNIPCNNSGYKLGCNLVVIAYSNILHNSNNVSKGSIQQPKCNYQIFSILVKNQLFIINLHISQHRYCIWNISHFLHLTWWFLKFSIYVMCLWVWFVSYKKNMYPFINFKSEQ